MMLDDVLAAVQDAQSKLRFAGYPEYAWMLMPLCDLILLELAREDAEREDDSEDDDEEE